MVLTNHEKIHFLSKLYLLVILVNSWITLIDNY
jgi:hypothetical protein